jgi:flagellar biosynthesis protein FlhG
MNDQAQGLRKLMMGAGREDASTIAPQMIVFTGGKGGSGTTTLCVNVAVALAKRGERVILMDGNGVQGNVGALCGIVEDATLDAVLSGRMAFVDAVQPGPEGILVIPAEWAGEQPIELTRPMVERLVAKVHQSGEITDWVLLDLQATDQSCWAPMVETADEVIVVGNPDAIALMDTYARIKTLVHQGCKQILTVVNQSADDEQASESHLRLAQTAKRFLAMSPVAAGSVPLDPIFACRTDAKRTDGLLAPAGAASRAVDGIATSMIQRSMLRIKAQRPQS